MGNGFSSSIKKMNYENEGAVLCRFTYVYEKCTYESDWTSFETLVIIAWFVLGVAPTNVQSHRTGTSAFFLAPTGRWFSWAPFWKHFETFWSQAVSLSDLFETVVFRCLPDGP